MNIISAVKYDWQPWLLHGYFALPLMLLRAQTECVFSKVYEIKFSAFKIA